MKAAIVTLCLGVVSAHDALLDLVPRHARGGRLFKDRLKASKTADVFTNSTVNIFNQFIDHSDGSSSQFNQRYYIDTSYCADQETCPIFMYIGGEGVEKAFGFKVSI